MPDTYVAAACRADQHAACAEHPVVLCACACHEGRLRGPGYRAVAAEAGFGHAAPDAK